MPIVDSHVGGKNIHFENILEYPVVEMKIASTRFPNFQEGGGRLREKFGLLAKITQFQKLLVGCVSEKNNASTFIPHSMRKIQFFSSYTDIEPFSSLP